MTELIATCVIWMWIPGAGNTNYEFFSDGVLYEATRNEYVSMCRTSYYTPYTVWVVGLDDSTPKRRSENSNSATAQWIWNADFDGNGVVGFSDYFMFARQYGTNNPIYDADGNGIVGFSDYGKFASYYGQCNDGRKVVPCP